MSRIFMWAEGHRPKSLVQCNLEFLSENDQALLRHIAATGESPNIVLHGSRGTGKTTVLRLLYAASLKYDIKGLVAENLKSHKNTPWLRQISGATDGTRMGKAEIKKVGFCDNAELLSLDDQELLRSLLQDPKHEATYVFACSNLDLMPRWLTSHFIPIRFGSASRSQRYLHFAALAERCENILRAEEIPAVSKDKLMEIIQVTYPDHRQMITELQRRYQMQARRRSPEEHFLDYGKPQEFQNPEEFEVHIAAAIKKELLGNGPPQILKHIPKTRQIDGVPVSEEEWRERAWHHPSTRAQVVKEQREFLEKLKEEKAKEAQESAATFKATSESGESHSPSPKSPSKTVH